MKRLAYVAAFALLLLAHRSARADVVLGVTAVPSPDFSFGLKVTGVTVPSAANDMGIQVGDVLYNCNGKNLFTIQDLYNTLQAVKDMPNNLTLSYLRPGLAQPVGLTGTTTVSNLGPGGGSARV